MLIREAQHEIDKFAPIVANMQELQRRKELKNEIEMHRQGKKKIFFLYKLHKYFIKCVLYALFWTYVDYYYEPLGTN